MKASVALVVVAAVVGGCVETVKFAHLAPSQQNISLALAAERTLDHPQTKMFREDDPARAERLSICLKNGRGHHDLIAVRLNGDQVCGTLSWPINEGGGDVCYALDEIDTVGLPRDATTIGYYPVRGWLKCQGDT